MPFADQPIGEFLDDVASGAVTPSGGAVAAVGGAAGAALCEMVCLHTAGKDGYEDVENRLDAARSRLHSNRRRLLELADEDATAVDRLQQAFDDPSGATGHRQQAIETATTVPLETAATCLEVLEEGEVVVRKGNDRATADAVAGIYLAHAALQTSLEIVRTNLELIDDEQFVRQTADRASELERSAITAYRRATSRSGDSA